MSNGSIVSLSESAFESSTANGVSIVDFWAPWCGPCRMLGPILEQVAGELNGDALVGKVNVDEEPGLAARFGVRSIPAIFVLKDGEVVDQFVGVQSGPSLVQAARRHIG